MTILHHPGDDLVLGYAAGSLAESWSIAIAAHLTYCPICRLKVEAAENVGGSLLGGLDAEAMAPGALDLLLIQIKGAEQDESEKRQASIKESSPSKQLPILPSALHSYIGNDVDALPWQRLKNDVFQYLIETNDHEAKARILRIKAGRPVPSHGHRGRELTLVLSGSFEDELSKFSAGDLQDVAEETVHKPVAASGDDCICLAVKDAPLQFKELIPRILQPFLNI